ncbi:Gustatory receptor 179, partial [Halyomorpha halys]
CPSSPVFSLLMINHYLDTLVRRASTSQSVLVKLCIIHDRLAGIVGSIQKVYGFPFLFLVFTAFLYINVNIFVAVKISGRSVVTIIYGWVTVVSILIFRISNACGRIKQKGNLFYRILYNLVKEDKSGNLLNNTHLRAHLLKKNSFSINAAGFSELDLKFFSG